LIRVKNEIVARSAIRTNQVLALISTSAAAAAQKSISMRQLDGESSSRTCRQQSRCYVPLNVGDRTTNVPTERPTDQSTPRTENVGRGRLSTT
jgi:hypothetical protein